MFLKLSLNLNSDNLDWQKNIFNLQLARHIIFWLVFFGLLYIIGAKDVFNENFFIVDIPVTLIYVYLTTYLMIPFFLKRSQFFFLFLAVILFSLLISYFRLINYSYFYYSLFSPGIPGSSEENSFYLVLLNAKDFSFALFIFLAVKYTRRWLKLEKEQIGFENEQLESEIKLLKTQVDHHFLFNTLNNIYSLSVTEPAKTQYAVKKLWGILDFLVTYSEVKEIRIERELKLISDYVELERLRYGDRLLFEFNIQRNLRDFRIPPLLLYPFIENCFKHGSAIDPGNPWIRIDISEMPDRLRFRARNSRSKTIIYKNNNPGKGNNTEKLRKRLDYQLKRKYKLKIDEKSAEYIVQLDIFY